MPTEFLMLKKNPFSNYSQEISWLIVGDQNLGKEKQKPPHFWLRELQGAEEEKEIRFKC